MEESERTIIKLPPIPTDKNWEEMMIPQVLSAGLKLDGWTGAGCERVSVDSVDTLDHALQSLHFKAYAVAIFSLPHFGAEIVPIIEKAREASPLTPFILLTDPTTDELGVNLAVMHGQVTCIPATSSQRLIELAISNGIREHEKKITRNKTIENSVNGTLAAFLEILSLVDPYSASLGQRLRYAVDAFTKIARLPLTWELETAAMLGQLGVLTIPVRVLQKHNSGQELTPPEKEMIARLPERGADLLERIPFFAHMAKIVRYQQKDFDGEGLPSDAFSGERLPLGSRILKLLNDLFRLEDGGLNRDSALEQMAAAAGKYDPNLLQMARASFDVDLIASLPMVPAALSMKELRAGHLLVAGVETKDGVLLVREGQIVSPRIVHKLRNFACMTGIREPIQVIDLLENRKMITVFQNAADTSTLVRQSTAVAAQFVA